VRIEWEDGAKASFRRFLRDQQGMRAVLAAVDALAEDPLPGPPLGFHRGIYHRLHILACPLPGRRSLVLPCLAT
jgi:hypothetical protein